MNLEEEEPLVRDIDLKVTAESSVLFDCLTTAGKGVLVHLVVVFVVEFVVVFVTLSLVLFVVVFVVVSALVFVVVIVTSFLAVRRGGELGSS